MNKTKRKGHNIIKPFCISAITEKEVMESLKGMGYSVLRGGWPDFLCEMNGVFIAIEVKTPEDRIRKHQIKMMNALEAAGIPCFLWENGKIKCI